MFFHSFIYRKNSFLLLFFISLNSFSQQIGDGFAQILPDFTVPNKSGMYNGSNPIGGISDNTSGWQHLILVRHPNPNNDHQLQIASSFTTNDRLFFRKIAAGLQSSNPEWIEVATRGANVFSGNQTVNGNINLAGVAGRRIFMGGIGGTTFGLAYDSTYPNYGIFYTEGEPDFVSISPNGNATNGVMNILGNGNVGIGVQTPTSSLDVRGTIKSYEPVSLSANLNSFQMINEIGGSVGENSVMNRIWFLRDASSNNWYSSRIHDGISVDASFGVPHVDTRTWWERDPLDNIQSWGNSGATYLTINNGNVGIGTTSPAHKLDVIGTIRSREVKVDMNGADFVFEEKYTLMPLTELEAYIKKNKHLPEIAPAKEMQEQGSNLGDLNTKLLQKIEELTLYVIDIKKENETLKQKYEGLEKRMNKQKK